MIAKRTWGLLTLVAAAWLGAAGHAQEPLPLPRETTSTPIILADSFPVPTSATSWYARGELLYLNRDVPRISISKDFGPTGSGFDDQFLNTAEALGFDFEAGMRLIFGRQMDDDTSLEFALLGLHDWDNNGSLFPTGTRTLGGFTFTSLISNFGVRNGFFSDRFVFPFDGASRHDLRYDSELRSAELNARRWLATVGNVSFSFQSGIRYVNVDEDFAFSALGSTLGGVIQFGEYAIQTDNHLLGGQIGADVVVPINCRLSVSGMAKAALLLNCAEQRSRISGAQRVTSIDPDTREPLTVEPFLVDASVDELNLAGLLELGIYVNIYVTPNVAVTLGYQGIFIGGLALGPNQLVFESVPGAQNHIDNAGTIFYHGPSAGVEIRW